MESGVLGWESLPCGSCSGSPEDPPPPTHTRCSMRQRLQAGRTDSFQSWLELTREVATPQGGATPMAVPPRIRPCPPPRAGAGRGCGGPEQATLSHSMSGATSPTEVRSPGPGHKEDAGLE